MKRRVALVLVVMMLLSFAGCKNISSEQAKNDFCMTFIGRYNKFIDKFNLTASDVGFNELAKILELEKDNYSFDPNSWSHFELNFDEEGNCYVICFGALAQSTIMPETNVSSDVSGSLCGRLRYGR